MNPNHSNIYNTFFLLPYAQSNHAQSTNAASNPLITGSTTAAASTNTAEAVSTSTAESDSLEKMFADLSALKEKEKIEAFLTKTTPIDQTDVETLKEYLRLGGDVNAVFEIKDMRGADEYVIDSILCSVLEKISLGKSSLKCLKEMLSLLFAQPNLDVNRCRKHNGRPVENALELGMATDDDGIVLKLLERNARPLLDENGDLALSKQSQAATFFVPPTPKLLANAKIVLPKSDNTCLLIFALGFSTLQKTTNHLIEDGHANIFVRNKMNRMTIISHAATNCWPDTIALVHDKALKIFSDFLSQSGLSSLNSTMNSMIGDYAWGDELFSMNGPEDLISNPLDGLMRILSIGHIPVGTEKTFQTLLSRGGVRMFEEHYHSGFSFFQPIAAQYVVAGVFSQEVKDIIFAGVDCRDLIKNIMSFIQLLSVEKLNKEQLLRLSEIQKFISEKSELDTKVRQISDASIEEHSHENEESKKITELKIYANIIGVRFIGNSFLDGLSSAIYPFIKSFLEKKCKEYPNKSKLAAVVKSFDNSQKLYEVMHSQGELAQHCATTIQNLKKGEHIIIEGGWSILEKTSHAAVYEISKNENDTYSCKIYEASLATMYHHSSNVFTPHADGNKPKYQKRIFPYVHIDQIPSTTICTKDIWRACFEIRYRHEFPLSEQIPTLTKYSPDDLYASFLPMLGGVIVEPDPSDEIGVEQQGIGNCPWWSLRAYLNSKLKEEFEPIEAELKIDCLKGLQDKFSNPNDLKAEEEIRNFLNTSCTHLSYELKTTYKNHSISLDDWENAQRMIGQIQRNVQTAEKFAQAIALQNAIRINFNKQTNSNIESDIKSSEPDSKKLISALAASIDEHRSQKRNVQSNEIKNKSKIKDSKLISTGVFAERIFGKRYMSSTSQSLQFKGEIELTPQKIAESLQACAKGYREDWNSEKAYNIRDLFFNLPGVNSKFWTDPSLSEKDCLACMEAILDLSSQLFNACEIWNLDLYTEFRADCVLAFYKSLAIQHVLACRSLDMNKLKIKEWKISAKGLSSLLRNNASIAVNFRANHLAKELLDYFNAFPNDKQEEFFPDIYTKLNAITYTDGFKAEMSFYDVKINLGHVLNNYYRDNEKTLDEIHAQKFKDIKQAKKSLEIKATRCLDLSDKGSLLKGFPSQLRILFLQDLKAKLFLYGFSQSVKQEFIDHEHHYLNRFNLRPRQLKALDNIMPVLKSDLTRILNSESVTIPEFNYSDLGTLNAIDPIIPEDHIFEVASINSNIIEELQSKPNEIKIFKVVQYFSNNLLLLRNEHIKLLLVEILCSPGNVVSFSKTSQNMLKFFFEFVQKAFLLFSSNHEISSACFVIYLLQIALERLVTSNNKELDSVIPQTYVMECLKALLRKCKTKKEKHAIYDQMVYYYLRTFDPKELSANLTEVTSILAFVLIEMDDKDPMDFLFHIKYCRTELHLKLKPLLPAFLKDPANCKQLIRKIIDIRELELPNEKNSWEKIKFSGSPSAVIGNLDGAAKYIFDLDTFVLQIEGAFNATLNPVILSNMDFRLNFPNFKSQVANIGMNTYQFLDSKNCKVIIFQRSQNYLAIQRQFNIDGPYYAYVGHDSLIESLHNRHLATTQTFWLSCEKTWEVVLCNKGTDEATCRFKPLSDVKAEPYINDLYIVNEKNPKLAMLNLQYPNSPYAELANFEDLSFVNVWINIDSSLPEKIEMPRLSLSFNFERNKSNGLRRAYCDQITDYYIAENQHLNNIGNFNNYLVLKNDQGKKMVIIPRKKIDAGVFPGGLSSRAQLCADFPGRNEKTPPYFEYNVDENDELESESANNSGKLHLALIYFAQCRYQKAQHETRSISSKAERFKLEEQDVLEWFLSLAFTKGDNNPKARAALLTVVALFWKNYNIYESSKKSEEGSENFENFIRHSYLEYLSQTPYVGELLLEVEEEIAIVEKLMSKISANERDAYLNEALLKARHEYLLKGVKPKKDEMIWWPPENRISNYKFTIESMSEAVCKGLNSTLDGRKTTLITRQENFPFFSFEECYKQFQTSPEKDWSELSYTFRVITSFYKQKPNSYYAFLSAVASNPDEFPPYEMLKEGMPKQAVSGRTSPSGLFARCIRKAVEIFNDFGNESSIIQNSKLVLQQDKKIEKERRLTAITSKSTIISKVQAIAEPLITFKLSPEATSKHILSMLFKEVHVEMDEIRKQAALLEAELNEKEHNSLSAESTKKASDVGKAAEADIKENDSSPLDASVKTELLAEIANVKTGKAQLSYQIVKKDDPAGLLTDLKVTMASLDKAIESSEKVVTNIHSLIIARANKSSDVGPSSIEEREKIAEHAANLASTQTHRIEIEDIVSCLLRKCPDELQSLNPFLTKGDLNSFSDAILQYLIKLTEMQKLKREKNALNNLIQNVEKNLNSTLADNTDFEELSEKLASECTANRPRGFETLEHLPFLIFEAARDLLLKNEQYSDVLALNNSKNLIIQRIMGYGKTDILAVLYAFLQADGDYFPVYILPDEVLDDISLILQKIFGKAFHRTIQIFHFDRGVELSAEKLGNLKSYIEEARKHRRCLVTTSRSILCLVLRFVEALVLFKNKKLNEAGLRQNLHIIQEMLNILFVKGKVIIEEPDLVLCAKTILNFTFGPEESLDPSRYQNIISLYELLRNPKIHALLNGDPLGKRIEDELQIDPKAFNDNIKPLLVKEMMSKEPLSKLLSERLRDRQKVIESYLSGSTVKAHKEFVDSLDKEIKDLLNLLKEQVNTLLPHTLNQRYWVNYGSSQQMFKKIEGTDSHSIAAIPFHGFGSPQESSVFSSVDVSINLTIQKFWKEGYTTELMNFIFSDLQKDIIEEATIKNIAESETKIVKKFQENFGDDFPDVNLSKFTNEDCAKVANTLNEARFTAPEKFFKFLNIYILPYVKASNQELSINAIELVKLCTSIVGTTGTPYNSVTFAEKLGKNVQKEPDVDGKVIVTLYKQSQAKDGIRRLSTTVFPDILKELIRDTDDALMDAGAVLNNGQSNEAVSRAILNEFNRRGIKKSGIIFFQNNKAVFLENNPHTTVKPLSKSHLELTDRFVYFDQLHCSAVNVPNYLKAKATMTVHKDMTLRDFAQGAYRFRGIMRKQTLSLIYTPQVEMLVNQRRGTKLGHPIKFIDLLLHVLLANKSDQILKQLEISTKQKVHSIPRLHGLRRCLSADFSSDRSALAAIPLITDVIPFWLHSKDLSPSALYGDRSILLPKNTIILGLKQQVLTTLKKLNAKSPLFNGSQNEFISMVMKEIDAELSDSVALLPKDMMSSILDSRNIHGETTKEIDREVHQNKAKDVNLALQAIKKMPKADKPAFSSVTNSWSKTQSGVHYKPNIFSRERYFNNYSLKQIKGWLNNPKDISDKRNMLPFVMPLASLSDDPNLELFANILTTSNFLYQAKYTRPQLPFQSILYIHDKTKKGDNLYILELDIDSDFPFFWNALTKDNQDESYFNGKRDLNLALANLSDGIPILSSRFAHQNEKNAFERMCKEANDKRARLRYFLKHIDLNESDVKCLINMGASLDSLSNLYKKILSDNPKRLVNFRNMPLYEILGKPAWVNEAILKIGK